MLEGMHFSESILDFLREPNFMVLGTIATAGRPQMTIVWFEYGDGAFRVSTTTPRVKYRNVIRDPRVSFIVYDRGNPYRYLQVQGTVSNITNEGAHDFIDRLSARYTGSPTYKRDPERTEDRVILTITPDRFFAAGFAV